MLGLAPIAAAPISDDGDRLSRIQSSAVGDVALGGDSTARATVGASAAPGALFSLGGTASGNSSLTGRGAGGLIAAGNAHVIGAASAIVAGTFIAINTAVAAPHSAGSINGDIELAGQNAGRTKGSGELRGLWNGHGAAAAWSATLASGSGRLEAPGDAQGSASLQSGGAGSITFTRQLEADAVLEGTAAYGIGIDGVTKGAVQTRGIGTDTVTIAGPSAAGAVQRAAANSPMALGGFGQAETASTSRATAFGTALGGFAIGTTLQARFADIAGRLSLGVRASATIEAHAIADALFAGSMEAFGNVSTCSAITGGLSLARELGANVLATGETGREIGLAGKARAAAVTAADAPAVGMELTGTSAGQGASFGSVRYELPISGGAELASSVFAGASAAFTLSLGAVIANGVGVGSSVQGPLRGTSRSGIDVAAVAADCLGLFGYGAGDVLPEARLGGQFGIAGGATGGIASLGQGRGTLDVARDLAGDVDVLGDSAPAIAIVGHATFQTVAIGAVTSAAINLAGSARATNASHAQAQTLIVMSGQGIAQGTAIASSRLGLDISLLVEGIAPLAVESIGTWPATGHTDATLALAGSAETFLPIDTGAETHTGIAAKAHSAITVTGAITATLAADGSASDTFAIGRDSDTAIAIDADASRTLGLHGYGEGKISIAAEPRPSRLELAMRAGAASSAAGRASLDITTAGSATAQTKSEAASQGRLAVDRSGSVDVLVLGEALPGMPLLGASEAQITALAAANQMLAPSLAVSATNVIQLHFASEVIAPDGNAGGSNLVHASKVSTLWNLGTRAIAYRAPPALRRAEPPKYGLSGRLTPSNSGRILRG